MEKSPFVLFVEAEWPDIESPAAFELELRSVYPGIDILAEAKRARLWETTAKRRKLLHRRFLTNWLNRCAASVAVRLHRSGLGSPSAFTAEYKQAAEAASASAKAAQDQTTLYLRALGAVRTTPPKEAKTKIADILRKLEKA